MKRARYGILAGLITACLLLAPWHASSAETFNEARKDFKTKLIRQERTGQTLVTAPPAVFRTLRYPSPVGKLAAYLTPDPRDGKKHPAIIWITGGDCNSIDEVWHDAPASNDQTAAQYRKAGIIMMFPSLRGGNDNPGVKEGFFGEVDDILAAADYLRAQPYVDAERIYLGGHSTGGTLVLLTAATTNKFRAVFSFGPADEVAAYGPEYMPFDASNPRELELRAPVHWLSSIEVPVFVVEGVMGNLRSLQALAQHATNSRVKFLKVKGSNHFQHLASSNRLIAGKILHDIGTVTNLTLTEDELALQK